MQWWSAEVSWKPCVYSSAVFFFTEVDSTRPERPNINIFTLSNPHLSGRNLISDHSESLNHPLMRHVTALLGVQTQGRYRLYAWGWIYRAFGDRCQSACWRKTPWCAQEQRQQSLKQRHFWTILYELLSPFVIKMIHGRAWAVKLTKIHWKNSQAQLQAQYSLTNRRLKSAEEMSESLRLHTRLLRKYPLPTWLHLSLINRTAYGTRTLTKIATQRWERTRAHHQHCIV